MGDRRRNSFFESSEEENEEYIKENTGLDPHFRIETREPSQNHQKNKIFDDEPPKERNQREQRSHRRISTHEDNFEEITEENHSNERKTLESQSVTGWKPSRKRNRTNDDNSFAEELGPNKELQKKVRQQEEVGFNRQNQPESDESNWGSPPYYGNQEEFVQKKHNEAQQRTQVTRDILDDLWNDEETEFDEEELPADYEKTGKAVQKQQYKREEYSRNQEKLEETKGNLGKIDRKHDLFFQGKEPQEFRAVLSEVQEYISKNYSQLITENPDDSRQQMKRYISKYILDKKVVVEGSRIAAKLESLDVEM